jgi:predicted TIM-barrel fold metal-dependent hydrolase
MREAALYDGPIVDAHHHFWNPQRNFHPWLSAAENIPFRYGDYSAIKRRYFPEDYLADAGVHRVVATVYVETEWDPTDPIGETRFIHEVSARYGAPNAVVAQAWLDAPDAAEVLATQAGFERVRSVRHKPGGPTRPDEVGASRSLMSDDGWRRGFAELARHGLHFDLQTPWWNLPEAEALARDFPETLLILNHAGLPSDRSEQGLAAWHAAMVRFAELPNVVVKISGSGQAGKPWPCSAANGRCSPATFRWTASAAPSTTSTAASSASSPTCPTQCRSNSSAATRNASTVPIPRPSDCRRAQPI